MQNQKKTERIIWIDSAKALAILLVVIGHIIQFMYRPDSFDEDVLFRYIYSFHMPLFFMLSGLVTKPIPYIDSMLGGVKIVLKRIKKRFIQLVVPFCAWGAIWTITSSNESYYMIFVQPDISLWFLWVLFLINLAFYIGQYLEYYLKLNNIIVQLLFIYLTLKVISHIFCGLYGLGMTANFFFYFSIGIIISQRNIIATLSRYIIPLIVTYIILAMIWYRIVDNIPETYPQWISEINEFTTYRVATAISGSFAFICFCYRYLGCLRLNCLEYIGKNTLGIYAIHQTVILSILHLLPTGMNVFFNTTLGLFVAVGIVLFITILLLEILKTCKILNWLFL